MPGMTSWLGHRVREAGVHWARLRDPARRPSVVMFPSGGPDEGSARLRAWCMADPLRALGWRVVVVPPQLELSQRRRILDAESPDVVYVQKARHPLNRPALYKPGPRFVFDLDDADYLDPRQLGPIEECCRGSTLVTAGSANVAAWCGRLCPRVEVIWVSHPVPRERPTPAPSQRAAVVAWAHADPLSYPVECALVRRIIPAAARLKPFEFRLYGARDAAKIAEFLAPIVAAGVPVRTYGYFPKYDDYAATLREAAVGIHPVCLENPYSHGKSFGKILSYLAAGVPVVTDDVLDHAVFFRNRETARLVRSDAEWAESIADLVGDPPQRDRLSAAAWEDFKSRLSSEAAGARLDAAFRQALQPERPAQTDALRPAEARQA